MPVKPIPDGFHTVTPYLLVKGVPKLLEFLESAFDAEVREQCAMPDGTVTHAEARIGDSLVMMGDPSGRREPTPTMLYLYVPDCDAVYRRAIEAGGTSIMEPVDMFYGDRSGAVKDPFGNEWWIATHIEDVPPDELRRRTEAHYGQQG